MTMEMISKIGGTILVVGTMLAVWKSETYLAKSSRNSRDSHEIADTPQTDGGSKDERSKTRKASKNFYLKIGNNRKKGVL